MERQHNVYSVLILYFIRKRMDTFKFSINYTGNYEKPKFLDIVVTFDY